MLEARISSSISINNIEITCIWKEDYLDRHGDSTPFQSPSKSECPLLDQLNHVIHSFKETGMKKYKYSTMTLSNGNSNNISHNVKSVSWKLLFRLPCKIHLDWFCSSARREMMMRRIRMMRRIDSYVVEGSQMRRIGDKKSLDDEEKTKWVNLEVEDLYRYCSTKCCGLSGLPAVPWEKNYLCFICRYLCFISRSLGSKQSIHFEGSCQNHQEWFAVIGKLTERGINISNPSIHPYYSEKTNIHSAMKVMKIAEILHSK